MISTIKPSLKRTIITDTQTTGATGNVVIGVAVEQILQVNVTNTTAIALPFYSTYVGGNYVKFLDANTMQPLANTEVTYTISLVK